MGFSDLTLKKLFGLSGNECAYPGCTLPVIDTEYGLPIGQICHIKGKSPNGPRFDPSQTETERNDYANLIVMCAPHNKIVDDEATKDLFPEEVLYKIKREHEAKAHNTVVKEDIVERVVRIVIATQQQLAPPLPELVPVVEARMASPSHPSIDPYDFRIKLRNDGSITAKEFRLEVDIPRKYASNPTISAAEVPCPQKPDMKCYRITQASRPGFVLYTGDEMPDDILTLDFLLRHVDYADVSESIAVRLYVGDTLISSEEYPIRAYRHKERMDQLGLTGDTP